MEKGKLFLVPNVIAEGILTVVTPQVKDVLPSIHYYLAEDIRTARRYLSSLKIYDSIEAIHFDLLNKDTAPEDLPALMKPLQEGKHIGIISESGCPGIADPGAIAVGYAHKNGIKVIPLSGPSSLLMALMASGLNGQRFAFNGYLPIDAKEAAAAIKDYEKESKRKDQTQIFIETPYRNNSVFDLLTRNLHPETMLTIAVDITGQQESIQTWTVKKWMSERREWPKLPAVFLFLA